ncbi:MAG: DUF421 domain-containing protein [Clostridiaceae bacterium]|nr:DUF421 domain-containing protein [Clostridiaceae bacterium]
MLISLIRTLILYVVTITAMRVMGKRQVGELQPSELVVSIMISELATLPMESSEMPIVSGIVPIFTLCFAEVIFSFLSLKFKWFRRITTGYPSILINKGKVVKENMRLMRINLDDLQEELRLKGYLDISDVEYAILETSGKLSIIPKAEAANPTVKDLNLTTKTPLLQYMVINDGKIDEEGMKGAKVTMEWVYQKLKSLNVSSPEDVFFMIVDEEKNVIFQLNEKDKKNQE